MVRLLSILAVAAAFIPAVLANATDCNVSQVQLLDPISRSPLATISTDYEVTTYDSTVAAPVPSVVLVASQNTATSATFTASLNGVAISGVGDVTNPSLAVSGFNTICNHQNVLIIEVEEVKNLEKRMDSCRFKYEINLLNTNACVQPSN